MGDGEDGGDKKSSRRATSMQYLTVAARKVRFFSL